jgi:hypothetical protein
MSLLSTTGELFEKVILKIAQRPTESITLQCMRLADLVTLNFNNKLFTAALFLDI